MMSKKTCFLLFAAATCWCMTTYSCRQAEPAKTVAAPKAEHTFSVKGSVREMSIGQEQVDFPEHAGKAEFVSYCAMCHSLKYISMQPDFPRKTWEAEVTKMVVKYKAPIDSAVCAKIVDYLVAVKSGS